MTGAIEGHTPDLGRMPTREEKQLFIAVCRKVCPAFEFLPSMRALLNDLLRWCLMLDGPYDPRKGLWLWGNIGTGKSTMLEIVGLYCQLTRKPRRYRDPVCAERLDRQPMPYGFRTTNASVVAGAFAKEGYSGIETYIVNRRQAFDEVGRENIPTGYFGNTENVFQYILQRRYDLRHHDFTHVTSNLMPSQIGQVYGDHIYDRCTEMFNFVEMEGASFRR